VISMNKKNSFTFKISSVLFTSHVHATEDLDKVKQALLFLIPENIHDKLKLKVDKVRGHWNNPISLLQAKFTDTDDVMQIIKNITISLNDQDKYEIREGLERRIDKSRLYLRFDKQAAFKGHFKLRDEDDVIRLRITFAIHPSPTREKVKSISESLLMEN
jgi:RNA binding exosome subunit